MVVVVVEIFASSDCYQHITCELPWPCVARKLKPNTALAGAGAGAVGAGGNGAVLVVWIIDNIDNVDNYIQRVTRQSDV